MKKLWNVGTDDGPLATFEKREDAFKALKMFSESDNWRFSEAEVVEVTYFEASESFETLTYYKATVAIGDAEIKVEEIVKYPQLEDVADLEPCGSVVSGNGMFTVLGTDIELISETLRKYIARERYEFEVAARKVVAFVQPIMEKGNAILIQQIVDATKVNHKTVTKILILLQQQGFIQLVDPTVGEEPIKKVQGNPDKGKQAFIPILKKRDRTVWHSKRP